jgi:hypothetical protein
LKQIWKTNTPKKLKRLKPHNFSYQNIWQIWYEHRHVRDGWFRFMIFFMALYYDNILWWNLWWHIMMKYYEILWFEFMWWWMMMKWCGMMMYEMMWFYFVLILWWNDMKCCENEMW